jgi:hypothetical protein
MDESSSLTRKLINLAKFKVFGEHAEQRGYAHRDLTVIIDKCTHIYMLDGWQDSVGANAELACAKWCGCEVIYQTLPALNDLRSPCMVAEELVNGDRNKSYGHPMEDFARSSAMMSGAGYRWSAFPLKEWERPLQPEDIPVLMNIIKVSRLLNNKQNYHRDSVVDICGYMLTLEKCHERREEDSAYQERVKQIRSCEDTEEPSTPDGDRAE